MNPNWEHLGFMERLALRAAKGSILPENFQAKLVPHDSPQLEDDIVYIRIAIIRDGVEVGDVGLACQQGGWIIAGSGYQTL